MSTLTMKEHLSGMHGRLAEHHKSLAGHFETLSKYMAKARNDEARDSKGTLDAMAAEHHDMAEFHADCAEKCAKAAEGDLSKLVPLGVSRVAPDAPRNRAVYRAGQPQYSTADPHLEKIFGLREEDRDTEEMSLGRR